MHFYAVFLKNVVHLYSAPSRLIDTAAISEAPRYMARTKQRRIYVLALNLPSRSRSSFTDPERMEG